MQETLSVSSLNNQIKSLLESTFLHVVVEGEVSRFTYHGSGHLYFTLKDKNSTISCVMFRGNNSKMKFRLEEGMSVTIHGSISLYVPRGSYQLNCVTIEPAGSGALAVAYEQLKQKLKDLGYFEPGRKKLIPRYIKSMVLVTSATSAALQDMLRIAQNRWPLVKIKIIDTVVQGEKSGENIARNIKLADSLKADVIVAGRGGGSIEDLWGFNEEIVANAIFNATTPVISAVGHEIDFVISDFVSDLRAPTPSAAMEMILPDKSEILMNIDGMIEQISHFFRRTLSQKNSEVQSLKNEFQRYSFERKIEQISREIIFLKERFNQKIEDVVQEKRYQLSTNLSNLNFKQREIISKKVQSLQSIYSALSQKDPMLGLNDSFAQVVKAGKTIKPQDLKKDDLFELQTKNLTIKSKVLQISHL